jgi:hypothetical protein
MYQDGSKSQPTVRKVKQLPCPPRLLDSLLSSRTFKYSKVHFHLSVKEGALRQFGGLNVGYCAAAPARSLTRHGLPPSRFWG